MDQVTPTPTPAQAPQTITQTPPRGFQIVTMRRRDVLFNNFFGGVAWGLGSFIGATVVIAIGVWFLGRLGALPFIGDQINGLIKQVDLRPLTQQTPIR